MLTPLAYFLIVIILVAAGAVVLDQRNFIFGSLLIFSIILGMLAAYLKLTGYVIDQHWTVLAWALLAFPVIALLVIIVWLVHNTNIISHREGKSFTAKLSLFLALTLGFDFYLLFLVGDIHGAFARFTYILGLGVYNTFLLLFISYLLYSFVYQMWPTPKKADYIIVLGSYIHNGRVTPLLQSRVDKALAYYRAAAAGHRPKFVVSGGQGADESTSEANAMKVYLLSVGCPTGILLSKTSRAILLRILCSPRKRFYRIGRVQWGASQWFCLPQATIM